MFALNALVYPVVLAVLCIGAGLLVDRASGGFLPGLLLPAVGTAALLAVSQLTTYVASIAPATPYLLAVVALAGFALGAARLRTLMRRWRRWAWQPATPILVYVVGLAPVLLSGRATFSSYLTLADSAVHMMGADFLIHHGQDYTHLDLRNSYGQVINAYYNTSYPSGADTLFGGSALLLGLPLIWAFQPFNAFVLAVAAGPTWLLLRRIGLDGALAAVAALAATIPALVYGYELIGSIKEITALPMILTLGALLVGHERWLGRGSRGALPFALAVGAGVSALGVGFGAWVLAAAAVLLAVAVGDLRAGRQTIRLVLALIGAGTIVTLISALPTWLDVSGSLRVAGNIASTAGPGNLQTPLLPIQVFGVWLGDSYKHPPQGGALTATHVLIAITLAACLLGAVHVLRRRQYVLAGWLALTLAVWLAFALLATTWVDAKVLMLTSPALALLAWGGVAALRASRLRVVGTVLAAVLVGGVLASDALQYHGSNLAPTARFQELALVNSRFAGMGPTLFTDFDEYSLYVLRDLDVGGPNFIYSPPALTASTQGYRYPVELERVPPAALLAYPLIVTRRDPATSRPPSAYRLLWQGTYYQVWGRRPGAPAAIAASGLSGSPVEQCARIRRLARLASRDGAQLVVASSPELVRVSPRRASHPASWAHFREGLVMSTPGRLSTAVAIPSTGVWDLWLQGQVMPTLNVDIDGHPLASIAEQLGGNSVVPNTMTPLAVRLSAGIHRLSITRTGSVLKPGAGGTAILYAIFLTPRRGAGQQTLQTVAPTRWRSLCTQRYEWIEVIRM